MTADIPVIASSGNVFADFNIKNPEEALAKAKLVQQIGAIIRQKKLSQTAAAEICGVDQPKISKLLKGELYGSQPISCCGSSPLSGAMLRSSSRLQPVDGRARGS